MLDQPAVSPEQHWNYQHSFAESYYEIARVHAAEGCKEVALDFLDRALPFAMKADEWEKTGNLKVHSETEKILELRRELGG